MSQWKNICKIDDILPETGVCALLGDKQVAIFRPYHGDQVFAISNIGLCMEDESHSVAHYEARVKDGVVQLRG